MGRNIQISQPVTGEEEWEAVREPIMSGWLTSGPKVAEFERLFAKEHNVKHAIAVTSCTTALHLTLSALNIGPGDEVIVPAFTWIATANVVLYCGATPILADIDPETFNIDPNEIRKKITKRTKAIIPVHLFGLCADIDRIKENSGDIPLIEDAACASGSSYKGKPAGGLGIAGCFSFHPRKSITTGEGGMITTNNDQLGEKIVQLRNHGASISEEQRHYGPKPYVMPDFNLLGYNYRMTDLQGSIGIVQLAKLKKFINERDQISQYYIDQLKSVEWMKLPNYDREIYKHGWQSFVTMVDESKSAITRNQIMEELHNKGISTRPGTHAVHVLNYYKTNFDLQPDDFPNAKIANDNSMAIPLHNRMSKEESYYVVDCLKNLSSGV